MIKLDNKSLFLCVSVRSQRATGIGRLMVNIVEGIELKPCRSHGMNALLLLKFEKESHLILCSLSLPKTYFDP